MPDFLFDANHVTAFYNKEPKFFQKLEEYPPERKYLISKTTRGELEAGHRMASPSETEIADFWKFVDVHFYPLETMREPSNETSRCYGEIVGRLHHLDPKKIGQKTDVWLVTIGVQTNDIWFVAEAWSHRLVCVTNDKMDKIKKVVGSDVLFDDWRA